MSINQKIISTLSPLGYPVKPVEYTGEATTYLTFNYSTMGADYNNDAPGHEMNYVQVHFICPVKNDCVSICKRIKRLLFQAGFSYPKMINAGLDTRGKGIAGKNQHYVFECGYAEGVDLDG